MDWNRYCSLAGLISIRSGSSEGVSDPFKQLQLSIALHQYLMIPALSERLKFLESGN